LQEPRTKYYSKQPIYEAQPSETKQPAAAKKLIAQPSKKAPLKEPETFTETYQQPKRKVYQAPKFEEPEIKYFDPLTW